MHKIIWRHTLLKLACFNLLRNKRRNISLMLFIAVCVMSLSLFLGYSEYTREGIKLGAVGATGHISIAKKSYWDSTVSDDETGTVMTRKDIAAILNAMDSLSSQAWRIQRVLEFSGLIGTEHRSTVFVGSAYEGISQIQQSLQVDGMGVFDDDSGFVMMGKTLAEKLGVKIDDDVQLFINTQYGMALYTQNISGIVTMPSLETDSMIVFTNLDNAWNLLGNDGSVHKIQITITDDALEAKLSQEIATMLQSEFPDLDLRDWKMLNPQFEQVMTMYNTVLYFLLINFLIFIFISILQTIITISLERTKEFGTLRALGMSTQKLVYMILYEMLILSFLGNVIGFILVICAKFLIVNVFAVEFTPPGSTSSYPIDFFFQWTDLMGIVIVPIVVTVLLGTVYPLMRIARLEITKVLEG